jgi:hypothetical protein
VCFAGIVALRKGVESVDVRRIAFLLMPDVGSFELVHERFEKLQRAVLADYHHPTTRQLQGDGAERTSVRLWPTARKLASAN